MNVLDVNKLVFLLIQQRYVVLTVIGDVPFYCFVIKLSFRRNECHYIVAEDLHLPKYHPLIMLLSFLSFYWPIVYMMLFENVCTIMTYTELSLEVINDLL